MRSKGYATTGHSVAADAHEVAAALADGARLTGRVVDETGAPVVDATLIIVSGDAGFVGETSSAPDGSFAFDDLADADHQSGRTMPRARRGRCAPRCVPARRVC